MQPRCSYCGGLWIGEKPTVQNVIVDLGGSIGKTVAQVRVQRRTCDRCEAVEMRKRYTPASVWNTWKWDAVHILEIYHAG